MSTIPLQEPARPDAASCVFFAAGFRPFFLSAGVAAALMLPLWLLVYFGALSLPLTVAAAAWHGHEMVFGFGGAAVGGFLLTAVPNWTGCRPVSGRPLAVLFLLWLAGRGLMLAGTAVPPLLTALVDLSYLPVLGVLMARPLVAAGKRRNMAFLVILALLWLASAAYHLEAVTGLGDALTGVHGGMFLLLVMIAIVGGRIIPSFTQNWLRMQGRPVELAPVGWIEKGGAPLTVALAAVAHLTAPESVVAGVALLVAALVHGLRLSRWHGAKTLGSPILFVLHVGYGWMVAGFALLGLVSFLPVLPPSTALHALTAGSIATMILGVMSRAALGHSGRMLEVSKATVAAYGLVSLSALLRVAAPLAGELYAELTMASGVAWTVAWLLFAAVYFPVCTRPRADGRPG